VMARALSWMTLAPLFGPVLGGFLVDGFGWRACFVAMTVVCAVILLTTVRLLPETHRHPDPGALRPGPLVRTYIDILRSPSFRAHTLTVGASYGCLFSFISGSSFVMIQVLGVPVKHYGFTFSVASIGFLSGTMLVRHTLHRLGLAGSAVAGGALTATGGLAMLAFAITGMQSVAAVLGPAFVVLMGHGMLQPTCQMGAIAPFPRSTGAAAALIGFLMHLAAAFIGAWIGRSHDGTTLPLAMTIATLGLLALAAAAGLVRPAERARSLALAQSAQPAGHA
jgi:DHA1 family bicyclomycin/chloramphenicol resistance-like MFS transporter